MCKLPARGSLDKEAAALSFAAQRQVSVMGQCGAFSLRSPGIEFNTSFFVVTLTSYLLVDTIAATASSITVVG